MNLLNRGFPRHVRELIIARADGACEACGIRLYDFDDKTAVWSNRFMRRGTGPLDAANGILMCGRCHLDASSNHALLWGWRVPQYADLATRPAWIHLYGWVHLTNDGKYTPAKVGGAA